MSLSNEVEKLTEEFMSKVLEHSSAVRVFVVGDCEGSSSQCYTHGKGSYYEQIGSIKEWVVRQDERTKREANEA